MPSLLPIARRQAFPFARRSRGEHARHGKQRHAPRKESALRHGRLGGMCATAHKQETPQEQDERVMDATWPGSAAASCGRRMETRERTRFGQAGDQQPERDRHDDNRDRRVPAFGMPERQVGCADGGRNKPANQHERESGIEDQVSAPAEHLHKSPHGWRAAAGWHAQRRKALQREVGILSSDRLPVGLSGEGCL